MCLLQGGGRAQSVGVPTGASGESRTSSLPSPVARPTTSNRSSKDKDLKKATGSR